MEVIRIFILTLLLVAISGCGVKSRFLLSEGKGLPKISGPTNEGVYLTGNLPIVDGSVVDLSSLKGKTVVLLFASDTCDICLSEAVSIRKALKNLAIEPDRVRFLTAVVAAKSTDALTWKKENQVPWSVGFDEKLALFNESCGGGSVPCTVVQSPQKGIIFMQKGEVSVEEIRKITGPWETN